MIRIQRALRPAVAGFALSIVGLVGCEPGAPELDPESMESEEEASWRDTLIKPPQSENWRDNLIKPRAPYEGTAEAGDPDHSPLETASCLPDAYEPNDVAEDAVVVLGGDEAWFHDDDVVLCADDEDWFRIDEPGAVEGTLSLSWDEERGDVEVELCNGAGTPRGLDADYAEPGFVVFELWGAVVSSGLFKVARTDEQSEPLAYTIDLVLDEGGWDE